MRVGFVTWGGVAMICGVALLAGCRSEPKVSDQDVQKLLYPRLLEKLENPGKHPPVLVDVRSREAFATGHIPGAISIPLIELNAEHPGLSAKGDIIVYSADWTDALSASASKKLMRQGIKKDRVFDFRGGMDYWDKQGGQIVKN